MCSSDLVLQKNINDYGCPMANVSVKLKRSTIESIPRHCKTVLGLGLRKLGQVRTLKDSPQVRGMIASVSHLVEVVEVKETKRKRSAT